MRAFHFLILSFLVLATLSAQIQDHFDPDFFHNLEFAHRGGYAYGPENTIETIIYNLGNSTQAIEVDVQLTKDHQLVLFHDETVKRVLETSKNTKIHELTLEELQAIPLRGNEEESVFVPTLESMIDTLVTLVSNGEIRDFILELDFKPHDDDQLKPAVSELMRIIGSKEAEMGDQIYNYFFVSSFYPFVLREIRAQSSKIKTAFAVNSSPDRNKIKGKMGVLFAGMVIRKYDAQIIEPNICIITQKFVKKWNKKGILINGYTANTECKKEYLKTLNIAITSNCPGSTCNPDKSDQIKKGNKWCKRCD
ncbi:MAG: hypothetical protein JXR03_21060 [Cyclobacteriaceae bacterium]